MASLSCQKNGTKVIQFKDIEGRRRTVRLGKTSKRDAEKFKLKLESLIFARGQGHPPDEETAAWLTKLDRELLDRLAAVGLVSKPASTRLVPFIETYIAQRENELKPATLVNWNTMREHAAEFFGADRSLREVTAGDAIDFRHFLLEKKLAESTARKNCGLMKQVFAHAIEHEIITRNPFRKVPTRIRAVGDDKEFITQETIGKVIDACPNAELRAVVALARFGGVRIPSEIDGLKWEHILWDQSRIVLPSPKTERHEGRGKRIVPLFPELRPYLEELFELAPPGRVFLCETYRGAKGGVDHAMRKAIDRAGVPAWPRIFHNLRSSRQTELQEDFPAHVVCAWLGNTPKVAHESYLQVTDDHFARALQSAASGGALQNALHHPARTEHARKPLEKQAEKTLHSQCVNDARQGGTSKGVSL